MKAVVIFTHNDLRAIVRFRRLKPLIQFAEALEETLGEDLKSAHIVELTHPYWPPKGAKKPAGTLWCPHCREFRQFVRSYKNLDDRMHCEVCQVSDFHYYVQAANGLGMFAPEREKTEAQLKRDQRKKERREARKKRRLSGS